MPGCRKLLLDPTPQRIVLLRALAGLGDFLCTIPAFRALRLAFPEAEIQLLGLPQSRSLVQRFSNYLDGLLEFPGYPGLPEQRFSWHQFPQFLQQIQSQQIDLVIQMQGSGILTNPLAMLLGAKQTTGFYLPGQYCPDPDLFLPYLSEESEVRRYLRLLQHLGVPLQGEQLEFPVTETDRRSLQQLRTAYGFSPERTVCIHPGASVQSRCWPSECFASVAAAIAARGWHLVLTGSAAEVSLTEQIVRQIPTPVINLAGQTSLGTLAALFAQARLLICNDTGVSHLAAALQLPSIVIFTQSDPQRWAPLNRNRHRIMRSGVHPATVMEQAIALLHQEPAYVA